MLALQHLILADLVGTLAVANEPTLPLEYRLAILESKVRNAPVVAQTVSREERVRIAGTVDEVLDHARSPVKERLIWIKELYLHNSACGLACRAFK